MGKLKKRTIKYLRKVDKSGEGLKKKGHKRPRRDPQSLEEEEVQDKMLSMRNLRVVEGLEDDAGEEAPVQKKKSRHQSQLDNLRESDPEFFKYLESNDASLLDFDDGDDDGFDDEFSDDDDDEEEEEDGEEMTQDIDELMADPKERKVTVASVEIIKNLVDMSNAGSISSLRKLMSVFRATCIPDSTGDNSDDDEDDKPTKKETISNSYVVDDPAVYEFAMTEILENAHKSFYIILGLSENLTTNILESLEQHPKWKKVQFLVISFFKSILQTLTSLADSTATIKSSKDEEQKDHEKSNQSGNVGSYVLSCLDPYIPLLAPLPRLSKRTMKTFLRLWAHGPSPEDDDTNVRGQAFLRIRQMAMCLPGTLCEECFRGIYLTYARTAKSFTLLTGSSVIFMAQCITELYTLDPAQAYQHSFLYIRQLALHLRTAMANKSTEATKVILNWQYLNCLRLWTRVLCAQPNENELKPLAFPLIQILIGVLTVVPSAVYVPLRFHLISCIQQLAARMQVFVPVAPKLLEILELHELAVEKPVASTEVPPALQYSLRFTPGTILKQPVRDIIVQHTINSLRYESEIYRFHVGLPEYLYLASRKLKSFVKKSKLPKWRDMARTLCNHFDSYTSYVKESRIKLGVSPMEIQGFEPLKDYYFQQNKGKDVLSAADRLGKLMSKDSFASATLQTSDEIVVSKSDFDPKAKPIVGSVKSKAKNSKKKKADMSRKDQMNVEGLVESDTIHDTVEVLNWSDDDNFE